MGRRCMVVTGGAGFIGSHVVDALLARGDRVVCVDAFDDFYAPEEKRRNAAEHRDRPGYELVELDIRDADRMAAVVADARPDGVLHLAARAGVRPSLEVPGLYASINVDGTVSVLEAARRAKVPRVVFASSSSVYGLTDKTPFCEDDPISRPASPYAATKVAGEALCHAHAHVHGLSVCALRLFTVYGPRQRPDLAIRRFTEHMLRGEPIALFGDGSSSRDYTYVDDVAAAFLAAADLEHDGYRVFNVGSSSPVTLTALVHALEQALGVEAKIEQRPPQAGDVPITYADNARARAELGWAPRTSLADGLAQVAAWVRARTA